MKLTLIFCVLVIFNQVLCEKLSEIDTSQVLHLQMFSDSDDPFAVCNDGTKGGYYFSKALDPSQSNVFVVHLPGGGQCYDKKSCDERADDMMSSQYFTSTINVTGILDSSPSKTPLWGANKAYLGYCSSDAYMGDVGASEDTWGYHFRGQRLVQSMIQSLSKNHGLDSASMVYMTGSSAGARGMMTQIDKLASTLLPASAKVIGFLDSPYYLDVEPYSNASLGFQYQEQQKYKYYNTQGVISEECGAEYPSAQEQWKCQYGEYRMPFVRTPYFIVASQYDKYQLEELTQTEPPYDSTTIDYAVSFGSYDRSSIRNLSLSIVQPSGDGEKHTHNGRLITVSSGYEANKEWSKGESGNLRTALETAPPGHSSTGAGTYTGTTTATTSTSTGAAYAGGYGFYTWACYNHAVAHTNLFYAAATNQGVSQRSAFEQYLAKNPADSTDSGSTNNNDNDNKNKRHNSWVMTWMDWCQTFDCGLHCEG